LNFERVRYWLGRGADTSHPVAELLGKECEVLLFGAVFYCQTEISFFNADTMVWWVSWFAGISENLAVFFLSTI
jgi:hypothetical protein